jgi:LPXTG-motif cell wall-anchored protein
LVDVTITAFSPGTQDNPGFGPPDEPFAEVPEPAGITLAGMGLIASLALLVVRRRRVEVTVGTLS